MLYLSLFTVPLSFNIQPPKIYLHYHSFYFFLLPPLLFSSWHEALTLHVHLQLRCRNLAHIALFSQSIRLEIYKKGTFFWFAITRYKSTSKKANNSEQREGCAVAFSYNLCIWTHGVTHKADCWLPSRIQALPLPFAVCSALLALIECIESAMGTGMKYSPIDCVMHQKLKWTKEAEKKNTQKFFISYLLLISCS